MPKLKVYSTSGVARPHAQRPHRPGRLREAVRVSELVGTDAMRLLLAHGIGDYILQTDHVACEKTKRWGPAVLHGLTYTLPFALFVTRSPKALAVIAGTHIVIDRYRLARYLVWAKNQAAPRRYRSAWKDCRRNGYPADRPEHITDWLLIVADNVCHLAINAVAARKL